MGQAPLRILMTADAVGGIWTYATDLAEALAASGAEVTLAVIGPALDPPKRQAGRKAGFAVVELGHSPEWLAEGPDAVRRGAAALAALAHDTHADLIHLNHPALGADGRLGRPTLAVCHSCVATWWSAVRGTPLPAAFTWQADLVGAGYRAATRLAAPSRAFAQATQQTYRLPQRPDVVCNGRSAPAMTTDPSAVPNGITVGRLWDEGKDIATLDRAAARATIPIRAVGPIAGPNGAAITLRHLNATGPADEADVRALLTGRPVYLSAARYEPFGLSVLEAAQAGCALVLSDIATFRELWDDAALFVAPGDDAGFAAALLRLVDDPSLRAQRGAAAQERAARFTLAATVEHSIALYSAMLGRALLTGVRAGTSAKARDVA